MTNFPKLNLKINSDGSIAYADVKRQLDTSVPANFFSEYPAIYWLYDFETEELYLIPDAAQLKQEALGEKMAQDIADAQAQLVKAFTKKILGFKNRVQKDLDSFAQSHPTRYYDSMERACGYVSDPNPVFAGDAQHCINLRSQVWTYLDEELVKVREQTRALPETYDDLKAELPAFAWPEE